MNKRLAVFDCIHADDFVKHAHAGQTRKFGNKEPYYKHCFRVRDLVAKLPNVTMEMTIAATLHDVLEDCEGYISEIIACEFGDTVASLVLELTNDKSIEGSREYRKQKDRERLKNVSNEAKRIKMCDRLDNLSEIEHAPLDFAKTYLNESELLLDVIGDADDYLKSCLENVIKEKRELFQSLLNIEEK